MFCETITRVLIQRVCGFFFFQAEDGIRDRTVTGVQTCALPIWMVDGRPMPMSMVAPYGVAGDPPSQPRVPLHPNADVQIAGALRLHGQDPVRCAGPRDRKSTRLNSSHRTISYAVFCLKKKK